MLPWATENDVAGHIWPANWPPLLKIYIASNARVSRFPTLAMPAPMQAKVSEAHTLPYTQCCFVIFASWQEDTASNREHCFAVST